MRTFQKTHPWLTFEADLRDASPLLWCILGECESKVKHIANAPLRPATSRELFKIYLAKGVQATTAIEGNTLTEEEVRRHIDGELLVAPSKTYMQQEVDNIVQACQQIASAIATGAPPELTVDHIKSLNRQVLTGMKTEEHVVAGECRTVSVGVGNYRGAPAEDCEFLLEKLCSWLNGPGFEPAGELQRYPLIFALLKAVLAHLYIAWIHPFGDGNGRVARLLEFEILTKSGVPFPSAHLLSNHYNQTRAEYYRQLRYASESGGKVVFFIQYAVQGFLDGLAEQLHIIWNQHYDIVWQNYVHELFHEKTKPREVRQRHLVLDLSAQATSVHRRDLPMISTRVALAYQGKASRTLARDLAELEELGLLLRHGAHYEANTEVVRAFLPLRANRAHAETSQPQ